MLKLLSMLWSWVLVRLLVDEHYALAFFAALGSVVVIAPSMAGVPL